MPTKLGKLTKDQQIKILMALVERIYFRQKVFMITLEMDNGIKDGYGTTVMNDEDRLNNRLMADFVLSDLGIPDHDNEALTWIMKIIES